MTSGISIEVGDLAPDRRRTIDAALATLPDSFRRDDAADRVDVVDGAAGWPSRVRDAADRGARGVLVVDPRDAAVHDVDRLSDVTVPVVLDSPWAHDPAIGTVAAHFRRLSGDGVLLEARAYTAEADLRATMSALVSVASALMNTTFGEVTLRVDRPSALLLRARAADGTLLAATVLDSPAQRGEADLRLVRGPDGAHVHLTQSCSAHPSSASATDATGRMTFKVAFESSHKGALVRLRDAVQTGAAVDDVARYAAVARILDDSPVGSARRHPA